MDWGLGNYELIAEQLLPAAEVVVEQAAISPGERVVDVGCGTGNGALLAAERGASVTGVDPVKRLLDVAAATAAERQLHASFLVGDAASIPIPDEGADAVISVFGAIFAPDPVEAADEITRVLAPGGRILLAAWVPGGPISDAIRLTRQAVAEIRGDPPLSPPFAWHDSEALSGLFAPHGLTVSLTGHSLAFSAPSVDVFMHVEGENHPVAVAARPVLEQAGRMDEVREGMRRIYAQGNEDPKGFRITSRYVVAELTR
jgi:SAM-dependent methyltransferase